MSRLVSLALLVAIISAVTGAMAVAEVKSKSRLVDAFLKLEIDANQFKAKRAEKKSEQDAEAKSTKGLKYATFGNGCFWCTEAVFEELHGVKRVVSGYSGGHVANPTYEQVCSKRTGHAEVIHLSYDPEQISFAKLLEVFWRTHDPTTLNQQGNDRGPQYRSVVFYHGDEQKELASHFKKKLNQAKAYRRPVVTEVTEFEKFYPAEGYHQNYYKLNPNYGYCRALIKPKLSKFRRVFADELAKNPKNRQPNSAKK